MLLRKVIPGVKSVSGETAIVWVRNGAMWEDVCLVSMQHRDEIAKVARWIGEGLGRPAAVTWLGVHVFNGIPLSTAIEEV